MGEVVVSPRRSNSTCRGSVVLAALALLWAGSAAPAMAQGPFEMLLGGPRYVPPEPLPPHVRSYADPRHFERESRRNSHDTRGYGGRTSYGAGRAFCVRTCDGRYFPLQRLSGASPAELCRSFCPASKTVVFFGSRIDHAVGPHGKRYADLDRAFAYRNRVFDNCSCNGKDGLGLARLNTIVDPTLRPGDIVATNAGLSTFRGKNGKNAKNAKNAKSASHGEFSPIDPSSSAWARQLSEIKIRPAPPEQLKIVPPTDNEAAQIVQNELRRAQLAR
jgi:hypothetical protein